MTAGRVRQARGTVPDDLGSRDFGAYALSPGAERLRRFGQSLGQSVFARWGCSLIRRVIGTSGGPFDVEAFSGQRARLYPAENLSDKRVFGAVQFWDPAERAALGRVVRAAHEPVYMVDAGANAGLYTLAVRAEAGAKTVHVLAIEPDPQNLSRLRFNLAASKAETVQVVAVALSDADGETRISASHANRGELSIGEHGTPVPMRPLIDLVTEADFPRVDALKIDIEGMEERVLAHYFANAPVELWPGIIVLEAQRGAVTPALTLLRTKGYTVTERTRMNAVLMLDGEDAQVDRRT